VTGLWAPALNNLATTEYTFTPTNGQCTTTTTKLTVNVNATVTPTFTDIAPICAESTRPVLPTTSNNLIVGTWNPAVVSNTTSGTYTFTPTGQCGLTTTLLITVYQSPTAITLTTTDVIKDNPDGIIEIGNITSGLSPFLYSINNSSFTSNTSYPGLLPGNYTITVKDSNGCEFSKVATINTICLFPNAISPNNDTYNDTFKLNGCNVIKLELFNRYGRKVNTYSNYTDQWDGTNSSGEALPDGTYFYVAEIKGGTSKTGWVFIAR
jgi:gliding motility-associated-like protein